MPITHRTLPRRGCSDVKAAAESLSRELSAAFDLTKTADGVWRAKYFTERRGVVFGGQMIGQAVVATTRAVPGKRVRTVQMVFAKGASLSEPVDISIEVMPEGRTVGSVTVTFTQRGRVRARALVLQRPGPARARIHSRCGATLISWPSRC